MLKLTMHVGRKMNQTHNTREYISKGKEWNKDGHIDLEKIKSNVTLIDRTLEDVIEKVLGDDLKEFNEKNKIKHPDRVMNLKDLCKKADKEKREVIFQVGNEDDQLTQEEYIETYKAILYAWQKDNPRLHVFGAYIHFDETTPHMHLDFVPIKEEKRGLKQRISLDGAIAESSPEKFQRGEKYRERTFIKWQDYFRSGTEVYLNQKYKINITPHSTKSREHIETLTYHIKEKEKSLTFKENQVKEYDQIIETQKNTVLETQEDIKDLNNELEILKNNYQKSEAKAQNALKKAEEEAKKAEMLLKKNREQEEAIKRNQIIIDGQRNEIETLNKEKEEIIKENNDLRQIVVKIKGFLEDLIKNLHPITMSFNKDEKTNKLIDILQNTTLPNSGKTIYEYLTKDISRIAINARKEIDRFESEEEELTL